jgi:hypothetical protein
MELEGQRMDPYYIFLVCYARYLKYFGAPEIAMTLLSGRNNKGQLASVTCALKDEVATVSFPCFPDTRYVSSLVV